MIGLLFQNNMNKIENWINESYEDWGKTYRDKLLEIFKVTKEEKLEVLKKDEEYLRKTIPPHQDLERDNWDYTHYASTK